MGDVKHLKRSVQYAAELREKATPAERELCRILDREKISYIFQANLCDLTTGLVYIADFRIRRNPPQRPSGTPRAEWQPDARKLFVEIDGEYHRNRGAYDARRTRWMESHRNAVVLRFTNDDVFSRPEILLAEIELYRPARKVSRISATSPWRHTNKNLRRPSLPPIDRSKIEDRK